MNEAPLGRPRTVASLLLVGGCLAACRPAGLAAARSGVAPRAVPAAALAHPERGAGPAVAWIVERLEAGERADLAGRTTGWAALDVASAPSLGFSALTAEAAQRINAFLPAEGAGGPAAGPFILRVQGAERDRALLCLTQAIYYEAALEPAAGQEAVAQTVLNRVRHPDFPHSVCGVVYQGSQQVTGCQYSFTCDGSRRRAPVAAFWKRAQNVAERALDGFVMPQVGAATAYHADYVFPRWGPTLVKIGQIGAHIFYRFPGPAGAPGAFDQRYQGGEMKVSMAGPSAAALAAAEAEGVPVAPPAPAIETYAYADPTAPGGVRTRVAGEVQFGRRVPTREEIARINATLLAMEPPGKPATAAATPAYADKLPVGRN